MTDKIVPFAKGKLTQILEAGRAQLPPEEYEKLERLIVRLQSVGIAGLTAALNVELGKLISQINWGLEISESPEWAEALIECDRTFLGSELREMYIEMVGDAPRRHKKEMCRQLYMMGQPQVTAVMEPFLKEAHNG